MFLSKKQPNVCVLEPYVIQKWVLMLATEVNTPLAPDSLFISLLETVVFFFRRIAPRGAALRLSLKLLRGYLFIGDITESSELVRIL